MAARGTGAAAGDAGDWLPPLLIARALPPACIPPGLEGCGLHLCSATPTPCRGALHQLAVTSDVVMFQVLRESRDHTGAGWATVRAVALEEAVSPRARLAAERNNTVGSAARLAADAVYAVSPGPQLEPPPQTWLNSAKSSSRTGVSCAVIDLLDMHSPLRDGPTYPTQSWQTGHMFTGVELTVTPADLSDLQSLVRWWRVGIVPLPQSMARHVSSTFAAAAASQQCATAFAAASAAGSVAATRTAAATGNLDEFQLAERACSSGCGRAAIVADGREPLRYRLILVPFCVLQPPKWAAMLSPQGT